MSKTKFPIVKFNIAIQFLRWIVLIFPVSIFIGLVVALFLWVLDLVTTFRWQHLWLLFLLPLAGILINWMYTKFGKTSSAGTNLVIEEIHKPGVGIPMQMTPLIFSTTILTHLFGGSAGREGTAVQMGASIAAQFAGWFKLSINDRQILLMCGMSAGFAAVFGTPFAGAVFALEVIGGLKYKALLPCLTAGIIAHFTCLACGILHTKYTISYLVNSDSFFSNFLLLKVIVAGILFGLVARVFSHLTHFIKNKSSQLIPVKWVIPVLGALLIITISYLLGSFDYLGLGVNNPNATGISILSAFKEGGADKFSWFWKLVLTAITLGMGFKGGEVTPLFFIGATLGNVLATITGAPIDLLAGLGFIAVFAGASNTPLACTIMGVELFGAENIVYYAVACFIAYCFSGHLGIYNSQKKYRLKL